MTRCPGSGALAGAVLGGDDEVTRHAASCEHCRAILGELGATRAALATLPAPALSSARRAALADAVSISAGQISLPIERTPRFGIVVGVAFAAACLAIVVLRGDRSAPAPASALVSAAPLPPNRSQVTVVPIVGEPLVQALDGATYEIERTGSRRTIRIRGGGGLVIESSMPVDVEHGSSKVALSPGRTELRTRSGAISSVHVFAGTAEISDGPRVTRVVAGETWALPVPAEPARPPRQDAARPVPDAPAITSGKEWFQIGWLALREGRHADALAAFDRADDPSIVEDAAFWAAFAAERGGDAGTALGRFEQFALRFPHSDRAAAAALHAARLRGR